MNKTITSNKIKTSLDDRRAEIEKDPGKWRASQRAKKASLVSSNKTQPKVFKSGPIKGVDLSKMISTSDVEPKGQKKILSKIESKVDSTEGFEKLSLADYRALDSVQKKAYREAKKKAAVK